MTLLCDLSSFNGHTNKSYSFLNFCKYRQSIQLGASMIVQQVGMLVIKDEDLNLILKTHMVEKKNQTHKLSSDLHMQTMENTHTHTM